jgi:hypothetical protein
VLEEKMMDRPTRVHNYDGNDKACSFLPEDDGDIFLRNVGNSIQEYTGSQPKSKSTFSQPLKHQISSFQKHIYICNRRTSKSVKGTQICRKKNALSP